MWNKIGAWNKLHYVHGCCRILEMQSCSTTHEIKWKWLEEFYSFLASAFVLYVVYIYIYMMHGSLTVFEHLGDFSDEN